MFYKNIKEKKYFFAHLIQIPLILHSIEKSKEAPFRIPIILKPTICRHENFIDVHSNIRKNGPTFSVVPNVQWKTSNRKFFFFIHIPTLIVVSPLRGHIHEHGHDNKTTTITVSPRNLLGRDRQPFLLLLHDEQWADCRQFFSIKQINGHSRTEWI